MSKIVLDRKLSPEQYQEMYQAAIDVDSKFVEIVLVDPDLEPIAHCMLQNSRNLKLTFVTYPAFSQLLQASSCLL